ncbi:MAG: ABC transporter permease [Lachnospiraceae bacterium]|nr:ABC transporter permease [Lachnospiraceae bacterium]
MKKYVSDISFCVGLALVSIMLLVLCVSFFWLPCDPEAMSGLLKLKPPSPEHWLGTDQFGRDIASRIMKGIQISFLIGAIVVAAGGVIGVLLGACSGYFGGWVDSVIMKVIDAQMAFPGVLLALMLIAVFGNGIGNTILALSIMSIPRFVRISRSGFLRLREADFVRAEKVRGASAPRIMFIHILPNLMSELAATASLTFASAVMSEAGLSYLGLGITPPDPSLGRMLSEAQGTILRAPWYVLIPAGVITVLVMGFNLLGDGIQQVNERR